MGQLKVKVKHAPSLTKCWARWARSCVDLVWIVLSCQATQAERPDSLTQSKPNLRMVLLHSAQHFWVTEAWITLTFNCPIQISNFFHKTSTVRCPLPAHLIKSMDIEKKFSVDKNFIWAFEGTDYILRCYLLFGELCVKSSSMKLNKSLNGELNFQAPKRLWQKILRFEAKGRFIFIISSRCNFRMKLLMYGKKFIFGREMEDNQEDRSGGKQSIVGPSKREDLWWCSLIINV